MEHSPSAAGRQGGVDPHAPVSPLSTWRQQAGWACIDVKRIRMSGGSLMAIGLAAALISRDETAFTEERVRTVYGLDRGRADQVLRELVIAGFLDVRAGLFHISDDHRAR